MRQTGNGWTALLMAAKEGHPGVVDLLLEKGADIEYQDGNGWTALLMAAGTGQQAVVESLLKRRANIWHQDKCGGTALRQAARTGQHAVVKLLLPQHGNSAHAREEKQASLIEAINNRQPAVVELLLRDGVPVGGNLKTLAQDPVTFDLLHHVTLLSAADEPDDGHLPLLLELDNSRRYITSVIDFERIGHGSDALPWQEWMRQRDICDVIVSELHTAALNLPEVRNALAGKDRTITSTQKTLSCAGILAGLSSSPPSALTPYAPYSGKNLCPSTEARFNRLASVQRTLLIQAGEKAEAALSARISKLYENCLHAVKGKHHFDQMDLYQLFTTEYGFYDFPAKHISAAFSLVWLSRRLADPALQRAFAAELAARMRLPEAIQSLNEAKSAAVNKDTFNRLINRQLQLLAAWCKTVSQPAQAH